MIAAASSSGRATRPAGARASCWFTISSGAASIMRVRVGPGATALTRTPCGPYSAAQAFVKSSSAARLAPYRPMPACPKLATIMDTLTIEPHPRAGHRWSECGDEEERNLDVQRKGLVELCFGGCDRWSEQGDASIV